MIYFFALLLAVVSSTYVGEALCSTYTTSAACASSGYCRYDGSNCVGLPCYLVNEVAACRSGPASSGIPTGALSTKCDSLE